MAQLKTETRAQASWQAQQMQGTVLTVFNVAGRAATLKAVTGAVKHHCLGIIQAPELPATLDSVVESVFGLNHCCQQEIT